MSDQERISCHHSITTSGRCDENKEKYQLKDLVDPQQNSPNYHH